MNKITHICNVSLSILISVITSTVVYAQPYSKGSYNAQVPYGSMTSLSIATSGDLSIAITPTTAGTLATGTSSITVTSTDVMGYKLYIRAINSTDMNNLGAILPASTNVGPATLSTNSWGYNTDGSNLFSGITLSDTLIHSISTPASNGDTTTVTYGIKVDLAKPAGNYTTDILYTAAPQTD